MGFHEVENSNRGKVEIHLIRNGVGWNRMSIVLWKIVITYVELPPFYSVQYWMDMWTGETI